VLEHLRDGAMTRNSFHSPPLSLGFCRSIQRCRLGGGAASGVASLRACPCRCDAQPPRAEFPRPSCAPPMPTDATDATRHGRYQALQFWAHSIPCSTQLVGWPHPGRTRLFPAWVTPMRSLFSLILTNVRAMAGRKVFWNHFGREYTLMWTIVTFYISHHGGGTISLERASLVPRFSARPSSCITTTCSPS